MRHSECHRQFTRGLVSSTKKPFSAEQVRGAQSEPCIIPRHGGLQSCRAAEHYRCQGANVVYHITYLSLFYLSQCFTSGPWKAERLR